MYYPYRAFAVWPAAWAAQTQHSCIHRAHYALGAGDSTRHCRLPWAIESALPNDRFSACREKSRLCPLSTTTFFALVIYVRLSAVFGKTSHFVHLEHGGQNTDESSTNISQTQHKHSTNTAQKQTERDISKEFQSSRSPGTESRDSDAIRWFRSASAAPIRSSQTKANT